MPIINIIRHTRLVVSGCSGINRRTPPPGPAQPTSDHSPEHSILTTSKSTLKAANPASPPGKAFAVLKADVDQLKTTGTLVTVQLENLKSSLDEGVYICGEDLVLDASRVVSQVSPMLNLTTRANILARACQTYACGDVGGRGGSPIESLGSIADLTDKVRIRTSKTIEAEQPPSRAVGGGAGGRTIAIGAGFLEFSAAQEAGPQDD
ncbi:hypothetical protein HOY82DRAFT_604242 [Tuber indicum]|nr:hypothetical protein HOY82DRAFT_604242 [Tuber indicum]